MQWDATANAGFSSAPKERLYTVQDDAADRPMAESQMADKDSLYHQIKHLIALRQSHPALQNLSGIAFVSSGAPKEALAYLKSCDEETLLIVVNPSRETTAFSFDGKLYLWLGSDPGGEHHYRRPGIRRYL